MKRAVVVFSGGQDSTTCLVQALQQYDEVHCVTFDYGQRHRAEIDVARELALKLGARAHKVLDVTLLNELAVSSLTRDSNRLAMRISRATTTSIRINSPSRSVPATASSRPKLKMKRKRYLMS